LEVEKEVNAAQIGCCRVMNAMDMLQEEHYNLRESHVPVLDRQSGVPIRVGGVIPKMSLTPGQVWRGAPAIGEDTTDIMEKLLGFSQHAIQEYYSGGIIHRTEPCTQPACDPI
jgi:crotonobetainyl-CoA:carnitine CoA-transferase CaiB-like acyl-CoA transferase